MTPTRPDATAHQTLWHSHPIHASPANRRAASAAATKQHKQQATDGRPPTLPRATTMHHDLPQQLGDLHHHITLLF